MNEAGKTALVIGEGVGGPKKAETPTGPTWGRLNVKHAAYEPELWKDLDLLYRGGFAILKEAARFIEKAPEEPEKYYRWRLKKVSYINYLGHIIGYLTGSLFGVALQVGPEGDGEKPGELPDKPFYVDFATDCDLQGTDFSQFMRAVTDKALVQKRALIGVDLPPAPKIVTPVGEAEPANRAQEQAAGGGRAYLFQVPLEDLYDWEKDDQGNYRWCKLHKLVVDRSDPLGNHNLYQHEFKIWRLDPTSGVATFSVYRTDPISKDDDLKEDDVIPEVTPPTATSFPRIPLVELELPEPLWAGDQIGPLAREHFSRRSDLAGAACRNLIEIPYVARGSEMGAPAGLLPSETQQDPNRGHDPVAQAKAKGFVAIGAGDTIGFAGPSGKAYELSERTLDKLREEIFGTMSTAALALANTQAAVKRSGDSKREDRSATGIILDFLGDEVRECAQDVYDVVSGGRNESSVWVATGINSYDDEERAVVVDEATLVGQLDIPSKTFHQEYKQTVAFRLVPKASQKVKDAIAKELAANVTDESVLPPKPEDLGGLMPPKPSVKKPSALE